MKFSLIYADPPWVYQDKAAQGERGAEFKYPCLSIEDLCNLPLDSVVEKDAVLCMWTTYPQLEDSFKVINAWGFTYKTCLFTWVKTNKDSSIYMGMGRYTRSNAEICLLAKKGKGVPRQNAGIYQTQLHPRGRHSEKPEKFREDLEKLFGDVTRLELFARTTKLGWVCLGNEVCDGEDIRDSLIRVANE